MNTQLMSFKTNDLFDFSRGMTEWDQSFEQLSVGYFEGHFTRVEIGGVIFYSEQSNQQIYEQGMIQNNGWTFAVPFSEDLSVFRGYPIKSGQLTCLSSAQTIDFRTPKMLQLIGLSIRDDFLKQWSFEAQIDFSQYALPAVFNMKHVQANHLKRLIVDVICHLKQNPNVIYNEIWALSVVQNMKEILCDLFFIPKLEMQKPIYAPRQRIVKKARDYIHAHLRDVIDIEMICHEINTSRRTLQYSFETILGISPLQYIQSLRLYEVRRMLQNQDHINEPMLDIAAEFGFWHASHFREQYKKMFNELPSVTRHQCDASRSVT